MFFVSDLFIRLGPTRDWPPHCLLYAESVPSKDILTHSIMDVSEKVLKLLLVGDAGVGKV